MLALTACFNPPAQSDATAVDPTGDPPVTTTATDDATSAAATPVTAADPDTTISTGSESSTPTTGLEPTTDDATTAPDACDNTCGGPTPYCLTNGTCGACTQLKEDGTSCVEIDPSRPTCNDDSGACFGCVVDSECVAVPDAAFCEAETGACGPCREHSDCPASACDMLAGICFPIDASTRHTWTGPGPCNLGECTSDMPCCELADALATSIADGTVYHVIHAAGSLYTQPVLLKAAGHTVAILGGPDVQLVVNSMGMSPAIALGNYPQELQIDAGKLFISGIEIVGGTAASAVQVWRSTGLVLDDAYIQSQAMGPPLIANNACSGSAAPASSTTSAASTAAPAAASN